MRRLPVTALVLLFAGAAGAQGIYPDRAFETSYAVRDLAGADFDGDGDRDLVSLSSSPGLGELWLNDGAGGLAAVVTLTAGAAPQRVRLLDVNLDGALDVLVACSGQGGTPPVGGVSVNLGDGATGFFASTWRAVNGQPRDVAVADVNGDGFPDAATANFQSANASVMLGLGTGGFGPPLNLGAPAQPCGVALSDVDADGDADLLVAATLGASVSRRLNAGGIFGAAVLTPVGAPPAGLLSAPLDGDAFDDLLLPCSDGTLRLLRADGAGGLLAPLSFPTLPEPLTAKAEDLDLDGDLDVVTCHGLDADAAVAVLLNDGSGALSPPAAASWGASLALDLGDFDGDLLPDVAAGRENGDFSVFRGDGLGALVPVPFVPAGVEPHRVALADLDGDGRLDLAAVTGSTGSVTWRPGDGALGFGAATTLPVSAGTIVGDLVVADATGDGHADILTANSSNAEVALLVGDGAGGFAPAVKTACGQDVRDVVAGDLDGDGDADAVSCNANSHSVSVLAGSPGGLQPAVSSFPAGSHPTAIAMGHHDLDGDLDVMTANEFSGNIGLLLGDGAGGWSSITALPGDAAWVRSAAMADLDGDGDDELLTVWQAGGTLPGRLVVRASNGTLGFSSTTTLSIEGEPQHVIAADFDVDGALDVAVGHQGGFSFDFGKFRVTLLPGAGDGTLGPPQIHLLGMPSTGLAAGDLDGDGLPELAVTVPGQNEVALLRNLGGEATWTVLDVALPGDFAPQLAGAGTLVPGTPGAITLFGAPPLAVGALFYSTSSTPAEFKGGTLVPVPPGVVTPLVVPPDGRVRVTWTAWPPVASGSTFFFQVAAVDAGAPVGVALSNALKAVSP